MPEHNLSLDKVMTGIQPQLNKGEQVLSAERNDRIAIFTFYSCLTILIFIVSIGFTLVADPSSLSTVTMIAVPIAALVLCGVYFNTNSGGWVVTGERLFILDDTCESVKETIKFNENTVIDKYALIPSVKACLCVSTKAGKPDAEGRVYYKRRLNQPGTALLFGVPDANKLKDRLQNSIKSIERQKAQEI